MIEKYSKVHVACGLLGYFGLYSFGSFCGQHIPFKFSKLSIYCYVFKGAIEGDGHCVV